MPKTPLQRAAKIRKVESKPKPGMKSAFPEKKKPEPKPTPKAEAPKPTPKAKVAPAPKKQLKKAKVKIHERPKKPEGQKMKQTPGADFKTNSPSSNIDTTQRDLRLKLKKLNSSVAALKKSAKSPERKRRARGLAAEANSALKRIERAKKQGKELPRGKSLKSNQRQSFKTVFIKGKKTLIESTGNIRKGFGKGKKNPRDTTAAKKLAIGIGKMAGPFSAILRKIQPLLKLVPIVAAADAVSSAGKTIADERSGKASKARAKSKELSKR